MRNGPGGVSRCLAPCGRLDEQPSPGGCADDEAAFARGSWSPSSSTPARWWPSAACRPSTSSAHFGIQFVTPAEVADGIAAGVRLGHAVDLPTWVEVVPVPGGVQRLNIAALDGGEAAVIELAIALGVKTVCIDEWRGRRAATSVGLKVTGSLGLLGRAKNISESLLAVRPWIDKLQAAGIFYHPELIATFLKAV